MRQSRRRRARQLVLQALYQRQVGATERKELRKQFISTADDHTDSDYMLHLLDGVLDTTEQLDDVCAPHLDRPAGQLDPISANILRIGAFELLHSDGIPPKVALNEAVELARSFGPEGSERFINAVLDKVGHS